MAEEPDELPLDSSPEELPLDDDPEELLEGPLPMAVETEAPRHHGAVAVEDTPIAGAVGMDLECHRFERAAGAEVDADLARLRAVEEAPRRRGLASVRLPSGIISYYKKGEFVAGCRCAGHHRCTKTRQGVGASKKGPTLTGRPLGFLAAWLDIGSVCEDRPEHYDEIFTQLPL